MADIKKYSRMTDDLLVYGGDTTKTPTSMQQMMNFMKQEADTVGDLVDGLLWQPNTTYALKQVVYSSNLPAGFIAECKQAGQSGNNEPQWFASETEYSDGTCKWEIKNLIEENKALSNKVDEVSEDVQEVSNRVDTIEHDGRDYVIDTGGDGTLWFRKWKSGWLEQGGQKLAYNRTVNFLYEYEDTNYYFNLICQKSSSSGDSYQWYSSKTNKSITTLINNESGYWYACGRGKD